MALHSVLVAFAVVFFNAASAGHARDLRFAHQRYSHRSDRIFRFARRSRALIGRTSTFASAAGEGKRTLDMPVWNALYQVRNFAANVEDVRAQDASGAPADVRNTKTSEWEITAPSGCIVVSYDVYLDDAGSVWQRAQCRPRLLQLGDGAHVLPVVAQHSR